MKKGMGKTRKAIVSSIMSIVLAAGLCPAAALADDASENAMGGGSSTAAVSTAAGGSPALLTGSITPGSGAGKATGFIPVRTPVKTIHDENEVSDGMRLQSSVPSKYSSVSKGYVPAIRDQGSFGTCWTFSTMAAIEASMLRKGQAASKSSLDLSERHLAYFTYNSAVDPLGNTKGDSTTAIGSDAYDLGGNDYLAMNTLATWQGVVKESVAPYSALESAYYSYGKSSAMFYKKTNLSSSIAYKKDYMHVKNIRQIPTEDKADVKRAIMNYGAVSTAVNTNYFDASRTNLYNPSWYNAYYYGTNHAIALVGWDDSYSRYNFSGSYSYPSSDGAWLARNSWGTWYGDGGYFWISYEDQNLAQSYSRAVAYEVEKSSALSNIYQYDGAAGWAYNTVDSGGSIANIFTAKGNKASGGAEKLSAVSFQLDDTNVKYSVQVYLNPSAGNPTSGTAMLAKPVTGTTTYEGYYRVNLSSPVVIPNGSRYSVVITLSHANGSDVSYSAASSHSYSWVSFTNKVATGQSFVRNSSKVLWHDLASTSAYNWYDETQCSARIKAFTTNMSAAAFKSAAASKFAGVKLFNKSFAYDGKAHSLAVTGTVPRGVAVTYSGNGKVAPGTYAVTAKLTYAGKFPVTRSAKLTITKLNQSLSVAKSQLTKKVKYKKVKKKTQFTSKVAVSGAKAKVTYAKTGGSKKLSINKNSGKIKVKKKTKKGSYKITVRASAAATAVYNAASTTCVVKVKVK